MHRKGDVDFLIVEMNNKKEKKKERNNSLMASKRGLNEFESLLCKRFIITRKIKRELNGYFIRKIYTFRSVCKYI